MSRPRDRLGRPLRRGDDPARAFPSVPERSIIDAHDAWFEAVGYLERDLPFHAHETFELRWRCAPHDERLIWQALAQWGAALTHAARGNPTGATKVAARALVNLDAAANDDAVPAEIDLALVRASLRELLG